LRGKKQMEIVPGAGHLFEEPGTLDQVSRLALAWFERHLAAPPQPSGPRGMAARRGAIA
jgi:hypothetical protein